MLRMSDIAQRAGVSQTTVSFVLNGRDAEIRISEKTRQKVLDAAAELGYRQNQLARATRTGNSQMLGFLGGDLRDEHVARMLDGALQEAEAQGFTLKILTQREGEEFSAIRVASELRLMGVAALHLPLDLVNDLHAESLHCKRPMVLLDTPVELKGVPQVATDDARAIADGLAYLVGLGHTKIALASGSPGSILTPQRERDFRLALQNASVPFDEANLVRGDFSLHSANVVAARALLERPKKARPTAVFCVGDAIAAAVIQVAGELGLRVPADVSVLGFGDLNIAPLCNPALSTLRQPFRLMGRLAVRHLLNLMPHSGNAANDPQENDFANSGHLPVELIVRASCARPIL